MTDQAFRPGRLTGQTISWFDRDGARSNRHCLYCGAAVGGDGDVTSNKEHLIGTNFVPQGSMGGSAFNFLFRACKACNHRKSIAERHLSSVTLINGPGRLDDPRAKDAAQRKAVNDFHPDKPGVPMGRSHDSISVDGTVAGLSLSVDFVAPPRANVGEVEQLALNHIQGLFSLLTTSDYRASSGLRLLPPHQLKIFESFGCNDWGNPRLSEVTRRVQAWPCRANIVSADGYFKAIMRRHETEGWFWALEWNKSMRVAGAIGHDNITLFEALPDEGWIRLPAGQGRIRHEVPLAHSDDLLFAGEVDPAT